MQPWSTDTQKKSNSLLNFQEKKVAKIFVRMLEKWFLDTETV